jgi:hypothetical protein
MATCRRGGQTTDLPAAASSAGRRLEEARMRSGPELVLLMTLAGGVMFTLFAVVAWVTGRRVGGLVLAAIAGANFAYAIALLNR